MQSAVGVGAGGIVFEARGLTKRFGSTDALVDVDLALPAGAVVGLIGKNGSGKTTLLRHVIGLQLPTAGWCRTFGCATADLGAAELARIGVVHQEGRFLQWMRVQQQLRYIASFYERWDADLEERLVDELELDLRQRVAALSPGNVQKLAIIAAVCHHPALLLLDEPISALDPIARSQMLRFLLELIREEGTTVVISSHVLHDIETIVDRIVCLERGRLCAWAPLDELLERYEEWVVTSPAGALPARFNEAYVVTQQVTSQRARLLVRDAAPDLGAFSVRYAAGVETRAVNLERVFPDLVGAV